MPSARRALGPSPPCALRPQRIDVTKLYRSLDAVGKLIGSKKTAAVRDVQSALRSELDWIEQQNNLKGLARGW